jgi:DNA-binding MarR family transcriptional regulator
VAKSGSAKRPRQAVRPSPTPETGIGMLLRSADMAFNRYLRAELAAYGITFGQFQHLARLWDEDGLTQAELSRRIGIEMASSTTILDSLEQAGLIRRVRNSVDRRKINVSLTPKGAALEYDLMACAVRTNEVARAGLSAAEVASIFKLVQKVTANFAEAGSPPVEAADASRRVPKRLRAAE